MEYAFLKYANRVLDKFPVETVSEDNSLAEREVLLGNIKEKLEFICSEIRSQFRSKEPRRAAEEMQQVVRKGTLTSLWKADRRKAIRIIENQSRPIATQECPMPQQELHNYFAQKSSSQVHGDLETPPWPADIAPPPPEFVPSTDPFTLEEVGQVIKKLPPRKAPGEDRVLYEHYKQNWKRIGPLFRNIVNTCFLNRHVPRAWKSATIKLLLKVDEHNQPRDGNVISNWRPISLLLTSYKVYEKLLCGRLLPWLVDTERLSDKQKGGLPRNGLQEHVFCLKTQIEDMKHQSGRMHTVFVDLADAFGSIEHNVMPRELAQIGTPQPYCDIVRDFYADSVFRARTAKGLTPEITRGCGIVQGGPWSLYQFLIGIHKWVRWIDNPYSFPSTPNPIQAFVDDVEFTATRNRGSNRHGRENNRLRAVHAYGGEGTKMRPYVRLSVRQQLV